MTPLYEPSNSAYITQQAQTLPKLAPSPLFTPWMGGLVVVELLPGFAGAFWTETVAIKGPDEYGIGGAAAGVAIVVGAGAAAEAASFEMSTGAPAVEAMRAAPAVARTSFCDILRKCI